MTTQALPVRTIFGREPAAISAAIMAAIALISGFLTPIDSQGQALIQTVVGAILALYVALSVRENVIPAILVALQAAIPLAVYYGLDWTPEQQGLVFTSVSVILGLVAGRPNLTPKANPVIEGVLVDPSPDAAHKSL